MRCLDIAFWIVDVKIISISCMLLLKNMSVHIWDITFWIVHVKNYIYLLPITSSDL